MFMHVKNEGELLLVLGETMLVFALYRDVVTPGLIRNSEQCWFLVPLFSVLVSMMDWT